MQLAVHLARQLARQAGHRLELLARGGEDRVGGAEVPPRYMKAGQHCRIQIEGLGEIDNLVIDEPESTKLP